MQMTFKKIKRRFIGFFTGKTRLEQLKKVLRKQVSQQVKKELGERLKAERKVWTEREKARRKQERMPKRLIQGMEGNSVQFENELLFNGTIKFKPGAKGNVIVFREGSSFEGTIKVSGRNNLIEFCPHTRIRGTLSMGGKGCRLTFGDYTTTEPIYLVASGKDIHIGKWCMFSRNVEIRTTDSHAVVDPETGQWLNFREPVFIGDHVWICADANIMKGSRIQSNSIVAAMSLVNRPFEEEGVVLAGIPAKVVKRGVTWHRVIRDGGYTKEELEYHRYDNSGQLIEPVSQQAEDISGSGNTV